MSKSTLIMYQVFVPLRKLSFSSHRGRPRLLLLLSAWELRAWGGRQKATWTRSPPPPHPWYALCCTTVQRYLLRRIPFLSPPPCLPTRYSYDSAATDSARARAYTHKSGAYGPGIVILQKIIFLSYETQVPASFSFFAVSSGAS